jgi:hypothetical protein
MLAFVFPGPGARRASAQTGVVEGTVTDGKRPIPYANLVLQGTWFGAMTDQDGSFRFEVPAGRFWIKALAYGYFVQDKQLTVRPGETSQVSFLLRSDEFVKEEVVPRYAPKSAPAANAVDSLIGVVGDQGLGPWDDPAGASPIRHGAFEYSLRYTLAEQGDSVIVNVIAEARNVSGEPVWWSGYFSFPFARYGFGPDTFPCIRLGASSHPPEGVLIPTLEISVAGSVGASIPASRALIEPGGVMARGIAFSFFPNAFRVVTGVETIDCALYLGPAGTRWEDAEFLSLGIIRIPIRPIGMPIGDKCPWEN